MEDLIIVLVVTLILLVAFGALFTYIEIANKRNKKRKFYDNVYKEIFQQNHKRK